MKLNLLPQPKQVAFGSGVFKVPARGWIVLEPSPAAGDYFPAERLAQRLEACTLTPWKITRDISGVAPRAEIRCLHDADIPHDQGYRLTISATDGVELRARTAVGMFYAMETLAQIARQSAGGGRPGGRWPVVTIDDQPDLPRRGVYHDLARGKVPQLGTLLQLIDDLAALKINEFQLYIENTFEFRRHPEMYDDTDPLTAEELLILDEFCRQRNIDFVPSLTSLGHFEKILCRPAFRHLAEAEPEQLRKIGAECWCNQPWSLCVTDPGAKKLLHEMYDEFLPNFSSSTFNICCDESYDLGKVRSKELADKIGVGQMYVDWINYCNTLAQAHGKRIQMWGDIIRNHPALLSQLPADATLIEWGYEACHDFDSRCKVYAEAGKRFYIAPGTSSWFTFSGRSANAFGNMRQAAQAARKYGAAGFLNTDWGDEGHQQMLAVALLPFAFGAAVSWNEAGSEDAAVVKAAGIHVFGDPTGKFGQLVYDLGMTYERIGWQRFNASADWWLFREGWKVANYVNNVTPAGLRKAREAAAKLLPQFLAADLAHPDADLIIAEFAFTCLEIIHTMDRTLVRQQWLAADPAQRNPGHERGKLPAVALNRKAFGAALKRLAKDCRELRGDFEELWMARNKRSRVEDVLAHFDRCEKEYKAAAR